MNDLAPFKLKVFNAGRGGGVGASEILRSTFAKVYGLKTHVTIMFIESTCLKKIVTQVIHILNTNIIHWTDQKLQARLLFANRRTCIQTNRCKARWHRSFDSGRA